MEDPRISTPIQSLLLQDEIVDHVGESLPTGRTVRLRLTQAPPSYLARNGEWLLRLEPDSQVDGAVILGISGLEYQGVDPDIGAAFSAEPDQEGFVEVARVIQPTPTDLLLAVEQVLEWEEVRGAVVAPAQGGAAPTADPYELVVEEEGEEQENEASTDALDRYGIDLVAEAAGDRLEKALFRDGEVRATITGLCKKTKGNVVLLAEPGVGKTAVAEEFARWVAEGNVPEVLKGARVVSINLGMLSAGASHQNEAEGRWKEILDSSKEWVARTGRPVILFVDEIHTIMDRRSDFSQMTKEDLGRGRVRLLGATTLHEWRIIEKDKALDRRFEKLHIHEHSPEETVEIVLRLKGGLEAHHGVTIRADVVEYGVRIAKRAAPGRVNPDISIDLVDHAASVAALAGDPVLEDRHLHRVIADWRGMSEEQLGLVRPSRAYFEVLKDHLYSEFPGQERAVDSSLAALWRCSRERFEDPDTGVKAALLVAGQTDAERTRFVSYLSNRMFGEGRVITIECSDYSEEHETASLLGSPPGYVGHGEGGSLTNQIRDKGFGTIHFRDLDKGHPALVEKVLSPMLEAGHLVDKNTGDHLDISQFLVLGTAEVGGADEKVPGFHQALEDTAPEKIERRLRDELPRRALGMFDATVVLEPYSDEALNSLFRQEVLRLSQRFQDREVSTHLAVSEGAERKILGATASKLRTGGILGIRDLVHDRIRVPADELTDAHPNVAGTITVTTTEAGRLHFQLNPEAETHSAEIGVFEKEQNDGQRDHEGWEDNSHEEPDVGSGNPESSGGGEVEGAGE